MRKMILKKFVMWMFAASLFSILRVDFCHAEMGVGDGGNTVDWNLDEELVWDRVFFSESGEQLFMDAFDVSPGTVLDAISAFFRVNVVFDPIPVGRVSIHAAGLGAWDFVSSVVRILGDDYSAEIVDGHLRVSRRIAVGN